METKTLTDILQSFREDLPDHSKTATAIDQGASLAEISNHAQAEGLHEIATVLFPTVKNPVIVRGGPQYIVLWRVLHWRI